MVRRLGWLYEVLTVLVWLGPCAIKQGMQDYPDLYPGVIQLYLLQESAMPPQPLGLQLRYPLPRTKVRSLYRTAPSYIDVSDRSHAL